MEDLNRHFSKEDIQTAKKQRNRCSALLLIREMQVKTTVRYHLTLVRTAIIKISTNVREGVMKREPSYTVSDNVNWYSRNWEQYGGSLKTKSRTNIWFSNPTPGYISRENPNSRRYVHSSVHSSIIYNSQDKEAT